MANLIASGTALSASKSRQYNSSLKLGQQYSKDTTVLLRFSKSDIENNCVVLENIKSCSVK